MPISVTNNICVLHYCYVHKFEIISKRTTSNLKIGAFNQSINKKKCGNKYIQYFGNINN